MNKYLANKYVTLMCSSILLIFLYSCNQEKLIKSTDQLTAYCLKKTGEYYNIDPQGWNLDTASIRNYTQVVPGITNYFYKKTADTIYWHSFILEISNSDTFYNPDYLYKRYESNGFQHILLLGKNSDTLFYYQAGLFGDLRKLFVQGKYYYMYKFHQYNREQSDFFKKNIDSLTRIRGHNLPDL